MLTAVSFTVVAEADSIPAGWLLWLVPLVQVAAWLEGPRIISATLRMVLS